MGRRDLSPLKPNENEQQLKEEREMSRKQEKTKKTEKDDDEVEELLRAAQDDMLLSLSVDSHISHPRHLSDLDRRFQALKVKVADPGQRFQALKVADPSAIHDLKAVLGDDLSARFAALKASMPTPSSSSIAATHATVDGDNNDDVDEDDEVEKLMQWAKDAARLDPSPPSDDED